MSHSADRNLLFGILALQMDFIGRDDLIAALHAWVLDKAKPLGQILREQGKLAEDECALLEGLVGKHLEKHGNDAQRSLAAVSSVGSVRQDLQQIADADVQAGLTLVSTARASPEADATGPYVPPATLPPHARFLILRPHAKGGLGEVFVARDQELKREVALKEIQNCHADHPESRARFLQEAEVTGALEHPGIVPVYGLGTYADGRPFYAMRFIRGDSLKDAIRAFHEADRHGRADSERSLALRQLLGRFVDVCDAVAYAHSRGVLHRDLKPGNVMLGKYGETLVVDWGLAKVLGKAEVEMTEGPLVSSRDSGLTQAGKALGTPAFMSPEQAAGRTDLLGPRSDVYSLGATLYCLLTGRAPFPEGEAGEVLNKVQRGDFPPPRQINGKVSPALEAVCLKAMALKPEERYGTPREMAEEIERWLADEPVTAYREPLTARLGRWVRRHQKLTVAVGVLLLTGIIALAISTLLVSQAQQETAQALKKEEQARKERALAQVNALLNADPEAVPTLLAGLAATREDVLPRLRELWAREDTWHQRVQRGRVGLALLPVEPALVKNWLYVRMLGTEDPRELRGAAAGPQGIIRPEDPREILLLRDGLRSFGAELSPDLWRRVEDPETGAEVRFRALVALAAFDADDKRWEQRGEEVLEQLLTANSANALYLFTWAEALRPVKRALLKPLTEVFHGRKLAEHKQVAATLLAGYDLADRPELLAELALEGDARQYRVLLSSLEFHAEAVRPLLKAELAKTTAEKATDAEKDRLAFRQANAAMTLLHLEYVRPGFNVEEPYPIWPLLIHSPDPSRRTYLTHHLGPYGIDASVLLKRLEVETNVSARRALLLSLGEYRPEQVPPARRQELVARLVKDYRDDPDPGIHGAIEWLLRQWKEDGKLPKLRNHQPKDPLKGKPTWYVNGQGQTFTVIPGPLLFQMGSPELDGTPIEPPHRRKIPRSFAVGTKEVTVAEFQRFLKANPEIGKDFDMGGQAAAYLKKYSPEEDGPIIGVDWYVAAAYCNWLSQQEGLPEAEWCYPKGPGKIRPGMVMEEGYLRRKGYRLPTEAEWEYACRAEAVTSRYYGRSEALLGTYAWYQKNAGDRCHPVGRLRPNDLGLFDVLGNVAEWCQDRYGAYPAGEPGEAVEDAEDKDKRDTDARVLRGGAFAAHATLASSALRYSWRPVRRGTSVGLRVARTSE
jgi:formylglycine-generating enzyme required for sulfatase activity/tRNA A-37 threonylcarbamoyl transferase component Bud32